MSIGCSSMPSNSSGSMTRGADYRNNHTVRQSLFRVHLVELRGAYNLCNWNLPQVYGPLRSIRHHEISLVNRIIVTYNSRPYKWVNQSLPYDCKISWLHLFNCNLCSTTLVLPRWQRGRNRRFPARIPVCLDRLQWGRENRRRCWEERRVCHRPG